MVFQVFKNLFSPKGNPRNLTHVLRQVIIFIVTMNLSCIAIWEEMNTQRLIDIKKTGKLKVITAYNANSYYFYKDQPIGYEYELLKLLTDRSEEHTSELQSQR